MSDEQIPDPDAEFVEQLKAQHRVSRVHVFIAESGEKVFVRMPSQALWRRFRSQMHDERKRVEASELLFLSCLLHPDKLAFEAMCEERPGLLDSFANNLVELAGLTKEIEKKVL